MFRKVVCEHPPTSTKKWRIGFLEIKCLSHLHWIKSLLLLPTKCLVLAFVCSDYWLTNPVRCCLLFPLTHSRSLSLSFLLSLFHSLFPSPLAEFRPLSGREGEAGGWGERCEQGERTSLTARSSSHLPALSW